MYPSASIASWNSFIATTKGNVSGGGIVTATGASATTSKAGVGAVGLGAVLAGVVAATLVL